MHCPARPFILLALALALPATAQQQVYKWKDTKGVSHYGEQPPASGRYTTLEPVRDPGAPAASSTSDNGNGRVGSGHTSAAKEASDPRCKTARSNLATLQGDTQVQMDGDGDGKPDTALSDADRASQTELARATLKAHHCSETAVSG